MRAMMEGAFRGPEDEDDLERVCRMTSVMKWRSDGELTFGTTMASTFGACSWAWISLIVVK